MIPDPGIGPGPVNVSAWVKVAAINCQWIKLRHPLKKRDSSRFQGPQINIFFHVIVVFYVPFPSPVPALGLFFLQST